MFNSKKYWEDRYKKGGNSGAGSYNHLADFKSETLNEIFRDTRVQKVVEYGCGDGNQLSQFHVPEYVGYDVSRTIIENNVERFKGDATKRFIVLDDGVTTYEDADMVLSLDVIFHLVEDDVFDTYMHQLFSHPSSRFVIIYSTNHDEVRAPHVRDRQITPYITQAFPQWELYKSIPNPYADKPHPHGSMCGFYCYRKR